MILFRSTYDFNFLALLLLIEGSSQSSWAERHRNNRRKRKVEYKGKEVYINDQTYLLGGPNGIYFFDDSIK